MLKNINYRYKGYIKFKNNFNFLKLLFSCCWRWHFSLDKEKTSKVILKLKIEIYNSSCRRYREDIINKRSHQFSCLSITIEIVCFVLSFVDLLHTLYIQSDFQTELILSPDTY